MSFEERADLYLKCSEMLKSDFKASFKVLHDYLRLYEMKKATVDAANEEHARRGFLLGLKVPSFVELKQFS